MAESCGIPMAKNMVFVADLGRHLDNQILYK